MKTVGCKQMSASNDQRSDSLRFPELSEARQNPVRACQRLGYGIIQFLLAKAAGKGETDNGEHGCLRTV